MRAEVLRALVAAGASPALGLLVKATLLAALGLAAAGLTRRRSAAVRHLVVAATLGGLLLLPVATFLVPAVRWAVPVAPAKTESVAASFSPLGVTDLTGAEAGQAAAPALRPAVAPPWWRRISVGEAVVALWALGAGVFLAMFLAGVGEVRRLRRGAREAPALRGRLPGAVRLLLHESAGPLTYGVFRPVIVLPGAAGAWGAADVERALTHELEHIRRRDWLTFCAARLVCALYWFHPLVWILQRRLNLEAERACDDAVLRQADALAYADQLVGFAEGRAAGPRPPLLALAGRGDLSRRVGAVLDGARRRGRVGWGAAVAAAAAMAAITLAVSPVRAVSGAHQQAGLHFSVVSLTEWKPGQTPQRYRTDVRRQDPGRVYGQYTDLSQMVTYAFGLNGEQRVEGLPAWAGAPYRRMNRGVMNFTLDARMPASTTNAQTRVMLQTLLRDRFQLAWHWTQVKAKVLEMVVGPGGLKVKRPNAATDPKPPEGRVYYCPAKASGCQVMFPGPKTMASVADGLSQGGNGYLGRIVLDKTDLTGKFYFPTMTFVAPQDVNASAPSVPTVLRDVAGLELRPATDMIRVLVIDHVEKPAGDPGGEPPSAAGQTEADNRRFDAVSIRPAGPNLRVFGRVEDPVRLRYPNVTMQELILEAYGLSRWQLSGGPGWVRRETFALDAEAARPASDSAMMLMLRNVLTERFGLKLERAPRQGTVYDLEAAAGGSKLSTKTQEGEPPPWLQLRLADGSAPSLTTLCYNRYQARVTEVRCRLLGRQATTAELANYLGNLLLAPVHDAIGLKGKYNFNARAQTDSGNHRAAIAVLVRAVQRQLGVKLVKGRGTYYVYEIAGAHRPTAN